MTRTADRLGPPIHRNELFPAMQALIRLWREHDRPIIVQVAGVNGGEGTSTVARALADIVYAESRVGILLITFDTDGAPGRNFDREVIIEIASDAEMGEVAEVGVISARMHSAALRSAIVNRVDLDLGGDLPPEIGLVLLDTEPVLRSFEAAAIAAQVDGVFLVVSAQETTAHDTHKALAIVRNASSHFLGLILNRRRFRAPRGLAALFGLSVSPLKDWMEVSRANPAQLGTDEPAPPQTDPMSQQTAVRPAAEVSAPVAPPGPARAPVALDAPVPPLRGSKATRRSAKSGAGKTGSGSKPDRT